MTAILGHRGASALAVENTLEAFSLALDRGADGVELDVQLSSDGVVVVFHDQTLDRLASGASGPVAHRTWAELESVRLRDGAAIPRLEAVFRHLPERAVVNVELKSFGDEHSDQRLCDAVAEVVGGRARVVCSSFSLAIVERLVAAELPQPTLIIEEPRVEASPAALRAIGAHGLHLHDPLASAETVRGLLGAGLSVGVWTVNDRQRRRELVELGVTRVITDDP